MARQSWSKAYRITLLIDSVVLIFKFSLSIWLIVSGAKLVYDYYHRIYYDDDSYITLLVAILYFFGGQSLFLLVLIKWVLNFSQYRNENRIAVPTSSQNCNPSSCRFFSTLSWFFFEILHLVLIAAMIVYDWTEDKWLRIGAIVILCWEYPIFQYVITYKWIFRKGIPDSAEETEGRERTRKV